MSRCRALNQLLIEQNFPSIAIHRAMAQEERLGRYQQFKDFQKRILVATNLFGRGMDIERVNIVFNYDMPEDTDTYLHRVSRNFNLFTIQLDCCLGCTCRAFWNQGTCHHIRFGRNRCPDTEQCARPLRRDHLRAA